MVAPVVAAGRAVGAGARAGARAAAGPQAGQPGARPAALRAARPADIRAAAPEAEECISYGLPAFRLNGKLLVAFGAARNHCAFYPMSSSAVENHKSELKAYSTSKGTIRFPAGRPLPTTLVRKLVKARIAENERSTE